MPEDSDISILKQQNYLLGKRKGPEQISLSDASQLNKRTQKLLEK
jgi:hypothetical protein